MNDLRQQLADAIAAEHHRRAQARIEASPEEHAAGFADAAMAVVQPVLDAKDAEIKRLNEDLNGFCEDLNDALNHNDETCEAVKDRDRWRQRAEAAERRVANLQATLTEVTSNNDRMRAELDVFRAYHHQIGDQ